MTYPQFVQKAALCIFAVAALLVVVPDALAVKRRHGPVQQQNQDAKTPAQQPAGDDAAAASLLVQAGTPMPGANTLNVPVPPQPQLDAKSWVLMDFTSGQVLAGDNADTRVDPASITKIMTSYVVAAQLAAGKIKWDDEVYISDNAWRGGGASTDGSTTFLKLNSKVSLKDLMYGMIIQSGNDAAIALAEHVAGSEQTFAALMNQYAQQLGMTNTHYVNPTGLPAPEEYTTAHDIAILSRALIHNYPEEYKIYSIKEFEWNGITQHNRNSLLWRDGTVDGIKTGHTKDAGYCLATSAKRGDQRLIAVVMGTPSEKERADANQTVLNYGFRFFETHKLFDANKALASAELWRGASDHAALGLTDDLLITLPRGRYTALKASLDMPSRLIAPYAKGQQVGTVRVKLDDIILAERPLVVLDEQAEGGWWRRFVDGLLLFFKSAPTTQTAPVATVAVGDAVPTTPPAPVK